ncbi:TAP-like protein-domain-containing protein [Lasiosphaeria ovina]|uniref:TAP-like protein-domain-containing protein n=1 Tax=Lasiosphaeria ovina TaxID=92902 RepID=A0AAE0NMB6_9PEZI|nr:TAP-like protein-domain-containing protein [Lasiosphaeria ovina]
MFFSRSLVCLAVADLAQAASSKIHWGPCDLGEFNTTLSLQCATLRVPLDYSHPNSSSKIDLKVVKIPAAVQPSRGSIQLNFGGPGLPSRQAAVNIGPLLQMLSGDVYDLLAFDPRGTGTTIPFICTEDAFTIGQILDGMESGTASDTALGRLWARGEVDANICKLHGNGNDIGEFIGTASVARDMVSLVDALGEDGMLRYWGFSYGTTLGATVAAMFPERVDKLVIDGVQNPHDYYHADADFEEWTDSDKVLSYFFTSCIEAGPGKCALAAQNKTAAELEQDTYSFLDVIRAAPIPTGAYLADENGIKSFILQELKDTHGWPTLSQILAVLVYGSDATKRQLLGVLYAAEEAANALGVHSIDSTQSLWGIHCSDRVPRIDSFDKAAPVFTKLNNISRLVGGLVAYITTHCAQWPWHASSPYTGDFRVKTKNPILVASNSRDAHTPLRSALNVSAGFEGSGFLEVNGTGHATISAPSVCGFRALVAYWTNGTLPSPGTVCETAQPFDNYEWSDAIAEATGSKNATSLKERVVYPRRLL